MNTRFYRNRWLPLWLSAPQLLVMFLFFYLPVFLAFFWAFHLERPFGGGSQFVGMQNFERVLGDSEFWAALVRTLVYMVVASGSSIAVALTLALAADRAIRLSPIARNVLIWPKAIAAASIGVIFVFIFNPFLGILAPLNELYPGFWNPRVNSAHTWIMVYVANVWQAIPVHFHHSAYGTAGDSELPAQGCRPGRRRPMAEARGYPDPASDTAAVHRRRAGNRRQPLRLVRTHRHHDRGRTRRGDQSPCLQRSMSTASKRTTSRGPPRKRLS